MQNRSNHGRGERPALFSQNETNISFKSVNWGRLFGYLKPYRGRMGLALLALLVSSGFGLAFPLVIVRLLDSVTKAKSFAPLNNLALLLIGIFLLQAIFTSIQSYLLAYIGEHIVYDLRTSLYNQLQKLSLSFYSSRRVGDIVSRLSSDVTQMRTMLTNNLTGFLSQVITLIGAIVIVLTMNTRLTLFILALVPVLIVVAGVFGSRLQKASTQIQDQLADSTVVAEEGLQGIRVVKSFGREDYEVSRYNNAMEKTFRASLHMAINSSAFQALMMFLGFSTIAAIMWYGGREVISGHLTLAMITGFLMYGISIAGSLGGLAGLYAQLRSAIGGVQRVFEILDTNPTVQDEPDAKVMPPARGHIRFENVSFTYDGEAPVLQNVSLDIPAGEILALVGPSGAGKSTIFNLIPRFYDPTDGCIRLDGQDLRSVTQHSLREQIGIVPQETMLFGGTIRENILYGRLNASEEEMIEAAKAANAHEFIMAFPKQYDTVVGERGMNLSGGQRQRIAIARAILKDPAILLLDEATSSLDNESEGLVQEALDRLMQNRTTVIVAHRLSTIKVAHRIAVLDQGRIVELGTHDELMELNGLYARLYSMQFRDPEEELVMLKATMAASNGNHREPKTPERSTGLLGAILGRS
ncbi:MAG TPA: ABC transporter ATP-binding protein [Anaerolineales bacterium]|nr:ABC transporter ATP-binding protein [Anaerolineales bacterium]